MWRLCKRIQKKDLGVDPALFLRLEGKAPNDRICHWSDREMSLLEEWSIGVDTPSMGMTDGVSVRQFG
jgi:hypothetical protein